MPQRGYWIGPGCGDGLVADGEEGNEEREQGGADENSGGDGGSVGEILKVTLDEPVGGRPGDQAAVADEFEEVT